MTRSASSSGHGSKSLLVQASMQIGAGGSAGFVEVCLMHPLDLVKTRLQLQNTTTKMMAGDAVVIARHYNGVFDCMRTMVRTEGTLSLWKGILPPILAETPKRAVKFFTFEQYKQFFLFGADKPTPLTFSLAGLGAGVTEAILVNPFEVVKVQLQANRAKTGQGPGTWSVAKAIISERGWGLNGLNKGLSATIARNGVFNGVYFGFYHSVKGFLPEYEDAFLDFLRKAGIGFVSGSLASCLNIPFDVAKSRIQGPKIQGERPYVGTLATVARVARNEGFRALYKGLLPKVMRLGPGGAVMLVVYDYVYELLERKFT
ncbi:mitochondrial 2-oxodicarboxylate carrier [Ctenocephalides felis]|uniref:mitochondrial 2-oxodicarboxylate carrier n=1 Tax=Ctenocephalides felis TaxID=7515 RepID=UPI000E6E5266|nr:mitochondrial 2-oxodicarboxylate carrier [Ctenocephalides felis]